MDTLGQLFGGGAQMAPDLPVAAGQPSMFSVPSGTTAGSLLNKIPSTEDLQGILKTIGQLRSLVPPAAPPMSLPSLGRGGGGAVPAPSALKFIQALQRQPSGGSNPQMLALLRALTGGR